MLIFEDSSRSRIDAQKGNRQQVVGNLKQTVVDNPDVSSCANSSCNSVFTRLGEGRLYVFPVSDSEPWGLPSHIKQKALWLCKQCAETFYIRLDHKHHRVQLVHKPHHGGAA